MTRQPEEAEDLDLLPWKKLEEAENMKRMREYGEMTEVFFSFFGSRR
jgi:hypothetical protein